MTVIWPMIDKSQPQEMLIKYQADMNVQVLYIELTKQLVKTNKYMYISRAQCAINKTLS